MKYNGFFVGTDVTYSCVARHGRPSGVFKWMVVDSEGVNNLGQDSSAGRILEGVSDPEVEPDLQDSFTVTQVGIFQSSMNH